MHGRPIFRDPSGIQLSACFAHLPSVVRDTTTEVWSLCTLIFVNNWSCLVSSWLFHSSSGHLVFKMSYMSINVTVNPLLVEWNFWKNLPNSVISWNHETNSCGYPCLTIQCVFIILHVYPVAGIFHRSTLSQLAYTEKQTRRKRKTNIHFWVSNRLCFVMIVIDIIPSYLLTALTRNTQPVLNNWSNLLPTRVRSQAKQLDHTQPILYWSWYLCYFSAYMGHERRPTVCLWQQADNVAYCQRMSTDEIPWWASGTSLRKRGFNHMAPQAQHTLEEEDAVGCMTWRASEP